MRTNPNTLPDQPAPRYPVSAGTVGGGPVQRERFRKKFSLYSWTGNGADPPVKLIDDLRPYAVRPEGLDLIVIHGQPRVLFVEDRYFATGYGTRNAIHWPVSILGNIP